MEINRFNKKLKKLEESGNLRYFPDINNEIIDLSSNDYLSVNRNNQLKEDFLATLGKNNYAFSSCSSRLLSGNSNEYNQLEELICSAYKKESCLIYNSGYHANTGILPALTSKKDLILSDKLVHSSIIDGIKLSPAASMRYKHADYNHLENLLNKYRHEYENVFIVSESIFSMDGDIADLDNLIEIKNKYNCFLYLDEAHSVGVLGKNGLGYAEEKDVIRKIDFIIGTFGKAIASLGAFVVCDKIFKEFLINHSRTLIFTTALPPFNLAWTKYIFKKLPEMTDKRKALKNLSDNFAIMLGIKNDSHIIPFIIGSNHRAINASNELIKNGFNVLPIRHPTVPSGTARLRFSLNAGIKTEALIPIKNILKKYEKNLVK